MVNKVVFDYLSKYHGKYNLSDLKKKILSAGYLEEDINEAIKLLGLSEEQNKPVVENKKQGFDNIIQKTNFQSKQVTIINNPPLKPINNSNSFLNKPVYKPEYNSENGITIINNPPNTELNSVKINPIEEKPIVNPVNLGNSNSFNNNNNNNNNNFKPDVKKFKWMKLSGILGFIYILFFVVVLATFIVYREVSYEKQLILFGIFGVLFLSIFVFLYGFVKMGWYGDSKALRFAAKSFMILIILLIGSTIGLFLTFINAIRNIFESQDISSIVLSLLSGNTEILNDIGLYVLIFIGIFLFLFIYGFISLICFYVGLINVGKDVKFTKAAGLIGILLLILNIVSPFIIYFGTNLINVSLNTLGEAIGIISAFFMFLMFLLILFGFFNASRKFESYYV